MIQNTGRPRASLFYIYKRGGESMVRFAIEKGKNRKVYRTEHLPKELAIYIADNIQKRLACTAEIIETSKGCLVDIVCTIDEPRSIATVVEDLKREFLLLQVRTKLEQARRGENA